MTPEILQQIMPHAGAKASIFCAPLAAAMQEFGINTPRRRAAFLAQIAHESGSLRYVAEIASGEAYDTGAKAKALGNTPEKDGDGQRYKGRGLLQITGKANYAECGKALGEDFISNPRLLEQPKHAARSAAWYWQSRGLNELADHNKFGEITKRINGGYNGLDDRLGYWLTAREVLAA